MSAPRILVVEDNFFVADAIGRDIVELGWAVAGPAPSVARALALLETESVSAALLDIRLGGESVVPVADRLTELGCPFAFVSAYRHEGSEVLPERFADVPFHSKPLTRELLADAVEGLLSSDEE